jgi:signal transduction histidine kinase
MLVHHDHVIEHASLSESELQANRFRLLSRIADDLAHEVRNPLHAMVINLEVLRRRVRAGDAGVALERADVVEHEVHRIHLIVDCLLQLLRPDLDTDPVDLDTLVAGILPLVEAQARLARLDFHYDAVGAGAAVRVRRDDFRFAMLNLAEAALDSLRGHGGALHVTGQATPSEIHLRIAARAEPDRSPGPPVSATRGRGPATLDGALGTAAALLSRAGGRVLRAAPDATSDIDLLIVVPRAVAA